MAWPFTPDKPQPPANPEVGGDPPPDPNKPPEKTPAELIAESIATAMQPFSQRLDELGQKVDAAARPRQPQQPTQPAEQISVMDDENAAFNQRMTPIVLRQLELEARVVKSDIKREYDSSGFGDLWQQYEKQIDETLNNTPLVTGAGKVFRGDPDYIRNAVDMIFGRAARQAGMRFDGKNKSFFLESAGGGTEGRNTPPPEDGMTDDQRRVFNRMNVPLDKAKETMKKLQFIH